MKITLFYVIFFAFWRGLFLLFNSSVEPIQTGECLHSFWYGLRMDLAVCGYALLVTLLITGIEIIQRRESIGKAGINFNKVWIGLLTVICLTNIVVYQYWKSLINYRALTYLKDASEILSSLNIIQSIVLILILLVAVIGLPFIFTRTIRSFPFSANSRTKSLWLVMLIIGPAVIIIRGGLQKLPINESLIVYSPNRFLNHAAVNPVWHLVNDIRTAGLTSKNPFQFTDDEIAKKTVNQLFAKSTKPTPQLFTTTRPNIIILILESHTADLISEMGGENVSPGINQLIKNGFLFSSVYSSGSRTDQGIVSILSGWPATPYHSIMRSSEKEIQLPSLPKLFSASGYKTSFLYGGASNFSNLNVYCMDQKFQTIIDERSLNPEYPRGQWGVADEYVLTEQLKLADKLQQPFFSTVMTLSNHEPFDVPGPVRFPGNDMPDRFRNSAAYTDACLTDFFVKAKMHAWYSNTLFIVVADHGHHLPKNRSDSYPFSKKIPLLFLGDVLKAEFKGKSNSTIGGHQDLPATLLPQLNLSSDSFTWSKNLLDSNAVSFGYFQIEAVVGWVEKNAWFSYSFDEKRYIGESDSLSSAKRDSMMFHANSFLQMLYQDYKSK